MCFNSAIKNRKCMVSCWSMFRAADCQQTLLVPQRWWAYEQVWLFWKLCTYTAEVHSAETIQKQKASHGVPAGLQYLWEAFSSQNHNTCGLFFSSELRVNLLPLWHSTLYHLHVLNCCKTFVLNICKSFCLYSPLEQQLDPDSRGTLQCQSLRPPWKILSKSFTRDRRFNTLNTFITFK